jgi:hypothetical protein
MVGESLWVSMLILVLMKWTAQVRRMHKIWSWTKQRWKGSVAGSRFWARLRDGEKGDMLKLSCVSTPLRISLFDGTNSLYVES